MNAYTFWALAYLPAASTSWMRNICYNSKAE